MFKHIRSMARLRTIALLVALTFVASPGRGGDKHAAPIDQGQRVFTCGHSFHVFVPGILNDIARGAGIKDHRKIHALFESLHAINHQPSRS